MSEYYTLKQVTEILNVCVPTIGRWVKEGKINYITLPSGKRRYTLDKIVQKKKPERHGVLYARVSTVKQKDDLERQVNYLKEKYPSYQVIRDVGSGINYKRKGLKILVEQVVSDSVTEVVVAYRDRLCRFGYELLEDIFSRHETPIVVLNHKESSKEEEMVQDLLSILTVFSCRVNGIRKYHQKIKEKFETQKDEEESESKEEAR